MNKTIILLSFISLNFWSCGQKKVVYIEGDIKNIDSRKVYLVQASNVGIPIDSAAYSNNKFVFKIPAKQYSCRLVSIAYVDSNSHKLRTLDFTNHLLSSEKQAYRFNAFNIGNENILMAGMANVREDSIMGTHIKIRIDSISINAGTETNVLYRTQMMNFGYLEGDVNTRTRSLNEYLSIIEKYPTSQYLLSKIDENKAVLNKAELQAMLNVFRKESLSSQTGINLTSYTNKKGSVAVLKNLELNDENGNKSEIIKPAAKINMIVVWASWCSPCRQEIPTLKRLYDKYHNKGLLITSISIDEKIESWKTALVSEKMNWPQLIVPDSLASSFSTSYEISSIPEIIFISGNGVVLQRVIGFDKDRYRLYEDIIKNELVGL